MLVERVQTFWGTPDFGFAGPGDDGLDDLLAQDEQAGEGAQAAFARPIAAGGCDALHEAFAPQFGDVIGRVAHGVGMVGPHRLGAGSQFGQGEAGASRCPAHPDVLAVGACAAGGHPVLPAATLRVMGRLPSPQNRVTQRRTRQRCIHTLINELLYDARQIITRAT